MNRRHKDDPPGPAILPTPTGSVSVEKQLLARLDALRAALIERATALGWAPDSVDAVLREGGLPEWTREFVVTYAETSQHTVNVRAVDTAQAAEHVALSDGQHLVTVREVR